MYPFMVMKAPAEATSREKANNERLSAIIATGAITMAISSSTPPNSK